MDDDGDGYTENQGDCNDANNKIHPGAAETCGDGIDQDCNGSDLACSNTPAAPTGVKASDGTVSGKVNVTWNASTGATSYDVYRANMPAWAGGVPTRIAISVAGTSYDDTSAVGGNQYYYWAKAKNANGGSGYSMFDPGYWGAASSTPSVPTNAAATDGVSKAWISNVIDRENTATAIGTFAGFQSICAMLASSITGLLWYQFGASTAFLTTATITVLVVVYLLVVPIKNHSI